MRLEEAAAVLACLATFETLKRLKNQVFDENDVINFTIELFEKILEQNKFPPFDKMLVFLSFFKQFDLSGPKFKEGIIHIFSALTKTKDLASIENFQEKKEFAECLLYFFDKLSLNAIAVFKILVSLKFTQIPEFIRILCLAFNEAAAIERLDIRKMNEISNIVNCPEIEDLIPKFAHLLNLSISLAFLRIC